MPTDVRAAPEVVVAVLTQPAALPAPLPPPGTHGASSIVRAPGGHSRLAELRRSPILRFVAVCVSVWVVAFSVTVLVRSYAVTNLVVRGSSMEPGLVEGEHLVVDMLTYRFSEPGRGDVVIIDGFAAGLDKILVKRVVGVDGDVVELSSCELFVTTVGGVRARVSEPYLSELAGTPGGCGTDALLTVPSGHVVVLGDNRSVSLDSRVFGPVDASAITGRVRATFQLSAP